MLWRKLSALSSLFPVPALLTMAPRRKRVTLRPLNAPIVLPATQMLRLIKRECARIDRNGLFCALAVFTIPDATVPAHAQSVLSAMRERARLTDVVGWLDEKTLCAFLTDATLDGATAFAAGVRTAVTDRVPALQATVHNYDGKWAAVGGREGAPAEPVPALAMSA
jgi:hypothetical protein